MRDGQILKLFLVLVISTAYIFSFSHFGTLAYDSVINRNDEFTVGTKIGSLSVAEKTVKEVMEQTDEELTKWLNNTTITLKYKEKSEELDLSYFNFDIKKSVLDAKQGQDNPVIVDLEPLDDVLQTLSPALSAADLHMEELKGVLLQSATMLESGSFEFRLDPFLVDSSSDEVILAVAVIDAEFFDSEMDVLVGKTIEISGTSQFSLLNYVEDEVGELPSLSLSKLATAIYGVILPTNFDIIERHISNELPAYADLGFEAKADMDLKNDLVFSNPNEFSYFIEFEKKNGSLSVSLKGPQLLNGYKILPEDKETFEPKIILQFAHLSNPNEVRVKEEGKNGQLIKVYREHRDEKGEVLKKELLSEDFYPPIHRIEIRDLIKKEGNATIHPSTDSDQGVDGEPDNTTNEDETPSNPDSDNNSDSIVDDHNGLWGKPNEKQK